MPPHRLTNFEIKKNYENEPNFGGAYIANLDEYESIESNFITSYVNDNTVTYFDSFGVEHIPKEIKKFIGKKNIVTTVYVIQACHSIMCGYFCIGFIDFILKCHSLLHYTNLFSLMKRMIK